MFSLVLKILYIVLLKVLLFLDKEVGPALQHYDGKLGNKVELSV